MSSAVIKTMNRKAGRKRNEENGGTSFITFLIMLLALSVLLGASANPYYDAGSQMFTINVGPTVPFFTYNGSDNKAYFWPGINPEDELINTNALVGGIGSISPTDVGDEGLVNR